MSVSENFASESNDGTISKSNPFEEEVQRIDNFVQSDEPQYPLSLNKKNIENQYTPLSRLSQATNISEGKIYNQGYRSWNGNYNIEKIIGGDKFKSNQSIEEVKAQVKLLTQALNDLKCYCNVLEKRNEEIALGLEKQKLKSSHIEHALNILRKGEQQLDKKISEQSDMIVQLRQQCQNQKDKSLGLVQKLQGSIAQNNYLKELILIANSNYETLEKKYLTAVQRNKKIEQQNITKQKELTYNMHEMKNLLTNLISTPNMPNALAHNLSFGEQDENCQKKPHNSLGLKGQKKQAEDVYRNMFIKTLKGKK